MGRLRSYLEKYEVTDNGIYLENCKYVNYGFFGSLAVVSHDAAATYMANLDDCKAALNYMGHEKVTGNQAWGEDLFQQRCMAARGREEKREMEAQLRPCKDTRHPPLQETRGLLRMPEGHPRQPVNFCFCYAGQVTMCASS